MTQGYSGSYGINGTNLLLQPSEGKWNSRETLGVDGSGRSIYPALRSFELSWELMGTSELAQLINFQASISNTGTVVSDLPKWGDAGYLFYGYSGTILSEVEVGAYFNTYVKDVRLVISSIRTN
jgi:hypothetical protein